MELLILAISILSYHNVGHMLRNKGFKGPKRQIFDLAYLEKDKLFEKHYRSKVALNHALKNILFSFFT